MQLVGPKTIENPSQSSHQGFVDPQKNKVTRGMVPMLLSLIMLLMAANIRT
jgi:hypothetical protein